MPAPPARYRQARHAMDVWTTRLSVTPATPADRLPRRETRKTSPTIARVLSSCPRYGRGSPGITDYLPGAIRQDGAFDCGLGLGDQFREAGAELDDGVLNGPAGRGLMIAQLEAQPARNR